VETEQTCYCVQTIFVEVARSYLGPKTGSSGDLYSFP